MTNDTRVFLFTYQLDLDGSSLWDQLLDQGHALLTALDEACSTQEVHALVY